MAEAGHPLDASAGPVITDFPIWLARHAGPRRWHSPTSRRPTCSTRANIPAARATGPLEGDDREHWPDDIDAGAPWSECFRETRHRHGADAACSRSSADETRSLYSNSDGRMVEAQEAERSRSPRRSTTAPPRRCRTRSSRSSNRAGHRVRPAMLGTAPSCASCASCSAASSGDVRAVHQPAPAAAARRARPRRRDHRRGRSACGADGLHIATDARRAGRRPERRRPQTVVLRVVQEALQNVRKHARPRRTSSSPRALEDGRLGARGPRRWRGFDTGAVAARGRRNFGLAVHARASRAGRRADSTFDRGRRRARSSGWRSRPG